VTAALASFEAVEIFFLARPHLAPPPLFLLLLVVLVVGGGDGGERGEGQKKGRRREKIATSPVDGIPPAET